MHKVVTINLNGRGYQVDDDAYESLRGYLDRASAALQGNPDRQEILSDLEQALADKCQRFLGPHKSIVSLTEIMEAIAEMGPVTSDGTDAAVDPGQPSSTEPQTPGTDAGAGTGAPKRLYRLREGAMLGGVCAGFAAFLGIDVTIVRVIVFANTAIELALSHTGVFAIIYVILMFVLPEATTSEERAAASGTPFNAREIVDRIKRLSHDLDHDWKRDRTRARRERRAARRAWREQRRDLRRGWSRTYAATTPVGHPYYAVPYGTRVFAGLALPALTLLSAAAFWTGVYLVLTLLRAGSVIDWEPFGIQIEAMDGAPLWVPAVVVFILTTAITGPLHAARRAARTALGDSAHGWYEAWDGLLGVAFGGLILWFAYTQIPEVRDLIQHLPEAWANLRDSFRQ